MKKCSTLALLISLLVGLLAGIGSGETAAATSEPGHLKVDAPFVHPGLLHTEADFDRMRLMTEGKVQPYLDGWMELVNSPLSESGWTPRATDTIIRGGTGANIALLHNDAARAYQNALRWKISGSSAHGDTARDILNEWSSTLTTVTGNADRYLAAGLQGYQLANAAELMRDYPGFELTRMQNMLIDVFYKPLNERFLIGNEYGGDHNGAHIQNYWANWDLANMAATVAIGIFCDRRDIYEMGIRYLKHGAGNGSIYNAIPFLHPSGLAQWQESGRDQAHTQLGVGLMATINEMAWNQGDDLYGWANNRFLRAAEYVAQYNNGDDDVPFAIYEWASGTSGALQRHAVIADGSRNEMRPVWEMILNHYGNRKGLPVPHVAARAGMQRPEGGPNPQFPSSFDHLGFGTLLYTRPPGGGHTAAPPGGNVPDGIYKFAVQVDGKVMEAAGTAIGANVRKSSYTGGSHQQWKVTHQGGGQYSIRNAQSGLYLDVAGGSHAHGANFRLWSGHGGDSQRFAFIPTGAGHYRITPVHSNKPADVTGGSTAEGVQIQQWRYTSGSHQNWRLEFVSLLDNAAATLSGPENANRGQQVSWTASIEGPTEFAIVDMTLRYDKNRLTFDTTADEQGRLFLTEGSIQPLHGGLNVLSAALKPETGEIRILMGTGSAPIATESVNLLRLSGAVKTDAALGTAIVSIAHLEYIRMDEITVVDTSGASASTAIADARTDESRLDAAIAAAEFLYAGTKGGAKLGQYPFEDRAALRAAIDAGIDVGKGASGQSAIDQAAAILEEALALYRYKVVTLVPGQTRIGIRDLSIAAGYLGIRKGDAGWSEIAEADVLEMEEIDIRALAAIARMILGQWLNEA